MESDATKKESPDNFSLTQKLQEEARLQAVRDAEYDEKLASLEKKIAKQGRKHLKVRQECLEKPSEEQKIGKNCDEKLENTESKCKKTEENYLKDHLEHLEDIKKNEEEKYLKIIEGIHKNQGNKDNNSQKPKSSNKKKE